ncbi:MAG: adenine phosphoribosyltransferase [Rhodospirillaceae bacterium TMED8]|nr:adenine phosphoribosyltransferase [Magnetovibrio sp.]OUT52328.1 MAG: adenine phosphoribosyltransferase [Rhodospirillaceae bacterium TMED8]|tara:strand:+ start:1111 stop:1626 length:516 start_codon:yes stop_codon:yes gene_type:complete
MDLKDHIRSIPDFPKTGILFYDISTLLAHSDAWRVTLGRLARIVTKYQPDLLAGIESRGFLLSAALGSQLGLGVIMIRKKGKLPGSTISHEYVLEYGSDTIEIQRDAIKKGQRVFILDDLLATGGTMAASVELLHKVNAGVVGAACIIELNSLKGRNKLDIPFETLVSFDT